MWQIFPDRITFIRIDSHFVCIAPVNNIIEVILDYVDVLLSDMVAMQGHAPDLMNLFKGSTK